MLLIREICAQDPLLISVAFAEQGWNKPISQFEKYFEEQKSGQRTVLLAEWKGEIAGYLTIVWESDYPPFREGNIPEIVDFNILKKYQRRGIGTMLMEEAEQCIRERSNTAGIGVGLMHDYGNAQILYVKRGYVPDGRGIFKAGRWLNYGDTSIVDDDLALYFTKELTKQSLNDTYATQTEIIRRTFSTTTGRVPDR